MTASEATLVPDSELGAHLLDTGPLLCFGASPELAAQYERHFLADASVPNAVHSELARHAQRPNAPGDPLRRASVTAAAKRALRRYHPLLQRALPAPAPNDRVLTAAMSRLRELAIRRGKTVGRLSNVGEAECITHAAALHAVVVTNDIDAAKVAAIAHLRAETVVDLTRRIVAAKVAPKPLFNELIRVAQSGIDVGDRPRSYIDLVPKH